MSGLQKKDWMLILIVLLAATVGLIWTYVSRQENGKQIQISVDGEVYGVYYLDESNHIEVKTDTGINIVCIENGAAYMEYADCPDQYCVQQGKIHLSHETLVCLPHKLVVEVLTSSEETMQNEFDSIVK